MVVPSGTVTFLFTDIVGSTGLWQAAPGAMPAALERHDWIVRSAVESHGGYVFSTGGDGFGVAFARAGEAAAAAVEAQRGLGVEVWPDGAVLGVRMGLHTGEVVERGGDYFGTAVNQTARLMAAGHGGQLLCSQATAALLGAGMEVVDLGVHRLRDLSAPVRVFQLGGGSFPPLGSLDGLPGNLPWLATSFVGREVELAAVAEEVGTARLVTVTGSGGIGKTRLGLQIAANLAPGFAEGAWICELSAAATRDELAHVVASALGVVPRPQMTMVESIVDFLRPRRQLVVLDNCEHLLDATADLVDAVLAGAPGVRILATSREGLGIGGEHVWPVHGLPVAGEQTSDAVVLFAERARAVSPWFVLNEVSTPGVLEVCRRLDGIPLAIELAAARVAVMTPAEIAGHLDERFRLLTGGRRGGAERHQTLRAAVEWSYSLLEDTERAVFDRLGVFPASFDQAAAIAVCAGGDVERWDVIDGLAGLVAKSMVGAEQSGETTRYQLLETLRHFARDRLGELDGLRRRHAMHYAGFAGRAGAGLTSSNELAWRRRVAAEIDNLRVAAGWAFQAPDVGDVVLGVKVLDGLSPDAALLYANGMFATAASVMPRIDRLGAAQGAVVLDAAAHAALQLGDYTQAETLAARAVAQADTDSFTMTGALFVHSLATLLDGHGDKAMAILADGRRRMDTDGAGDWVSSGLHNLTGLIAGFVGDPATARSEAEQSLAIARRVAAPTLLANALALHAQTSRGQPKEALAEAEEAMRLIETGAGGVIYSIAAQTAARLRLAAGDTAGAAATIRAGVEHEARLGRRDLLKVNITVATAVLAANRSSLETAATLAGAALGPVLAHYLIAGNINLDPFEGAIAHVAAVLGHDHHTAAQQRGAAMTYDQIIAFTLEQLDRVAQSSR